MSRPSAPSFVAPLPPRVRADGKNKNNEKNRAGGVPHDTIVRHIRDAIRHGELRPGDRIKLRDELIREYNVSPVTLQRAFHRLALDGFVVPRGRAGTFVAARPPNLFRIALVFDQSKPRTLAQRFRLALSTVAARFAHAVGDEVQIEAYYGVHTFDRGDRARLDADLDAGRLAGLILAYPLHVLYPEDELIRRLDIPTVVFCHERPPAPFGWLDFPDLPRCHVDEAVRLGGRRVAVILHSGAYYQIPDYRDALARHGLEPRPYWFCAIDKDWPDWAEMVLASLFSRPEEDRPDTLIVGDDHLADAVSSALVRNGWDKELRATVYHVNFPYLSRPAGATSVAGLDCASILDGALSLLARMRKAERGDSVEIEREIRIAARAEPEVAAFAEPDARRDRLREAFNH